jgi:glycosyltransferase involved in cell wall biosynthesis
MPNVVILWMRFGAYHVARLRAVGKRLAREGIAVHGVEVAEKDRYAWDYAPHDAGFSRHCLFPGRNYYDLSRRETATAVRRKLDELQPQAVGINGWHVPEARAALTWCRKNRRKPILFSETKEDDTPDLRWKEWLKGRIARAFSAAVVGGRRHRDYVVRLGLPSRVVFLGYDAVDNAYFAEQSSRIRQSTGAGGEDDLLARVLSMRPYFYANTRFVARKNVDGLLRGYAAYRRQVAEPWRLVVTGSGEEEDRLRRLSADLGLEARVSWPGFVQYGDLPVYYALAGAFVHPAKSEPWGLVVNEACASGVPVLVSRMVGASDELVEVERNGLLFDPSDDGDIARALKTVSDMPEEARSRMGERSREIVAAWGPERFADAFRQAMNCDRNG